MINKISTIGLIAKRDIATQKNILGKIIAVLKKYKKNLMFDQYLAEIFKTKKYSAKQIMQKAEMVVTLGGDGTIIKTARSASLKDTLVLGVNMGRKGFLTEITPKKFEKSLALILNKQKFTVSQRTLLRVTVYRQNKEIKSFLALNEAVINQGSFARLISLRTEINQRKVSDFVADGLIVATPTGSTAHSLSAGGPILHPKIPAFILTPICPHSLGNRSIVVPSNRQIKITLLTVRQENQLSDVGLTLDGQICFPLKYGDIIKIRSSRRQLNIIKMTDSNYFKTLRTRIRWEK